MGERFKIDEEFSLTEIFKQQFPFYLAIGMTYEQYWHGEAWLTKSYREAYELKKQIKDYDLWRQGMYFYEALLDVSPVLHAFAKSGTKPNKYSEKPYSEMVKEDDEYVKQEKAEKERLKAKLHFMELTRILQRKFEGQTEK